jgi:filamentous hemagglutinin
LKNYNIETNQNGLINKVAEQAIQREVNLPAGMTQQIHIDIRGQIVSETQQDAIKQKIVEKSNGVIKKEDIKFIDKD